MSNVKCKFQVDATVGNNTRRQTVTDLLYLTTLTLYNKVGNIHLKYIRIKRIGGFVTKYYLKRERKIYCWRFCDC